jgi:hypothetical protein
LPTVIVVPTGTAMAGVRKKKSFAFAAPVSDRRWSPAPVGAPRSRQPTMVTVFCGFSLGAGAGVCAPALAAVARHISVADVI